MNDTIKLLLLVTCWAIADRSFAQHSAYCWSPNGINIREKPSEKSALIGKISYKAKVAVLDTIFDAPYTDTLNQSICVKGHWMKIQQGNVTGYAFNGYLSWIQPQTLYQFFEGAEETVNKSETRVDGKVIYSEEHTYMLADKSVYSYIVEDGCWDHNYFIRGGTLNDGLMLVSTTEPHDEGCAFAFIKTEGNKYFLADCDASQDRMIEVTKDGITYHSNDCD